jgi:hypothetical protein
LGCRRLFAQDRTLLATVVAERRRAEAQTRRRPRTDGGRRRAARSGSNWREIHTYDHEDWVDILRWTPEGQSLLFVARPVRAPTWRMMRIPAAGGAAEFDGLDSAAFVSNVRSRRSVPAR